MITYLPDELFNTRKFQLSYSDLREEYMKFCDMNDEAFMQRLPDAIHLACIICWLKEVGNDATIGDLGIIHELVHLLKENGTTTSLRDIRKQFEDILKLH